MNMAQREKIKQHFRDNKKVYIAGTIGVLVGAAGLGTVLLLRGKVDPDVAQKITQIGFRNEANPVIIQLIELSTPSKPVHLLGTGEYFNSINDAARQTGYSARDISLNVRHLIDNVKGDVFELIEPAA